MIKRIPQINILAAREKELRAQIKKQNRLYERRLEAKGVNDKASFEALQRLLKLGASIHEERWKYNRIQILELHARLKNLKPESKQALKIMQNIVRLTSELQTDSREYASLWNQMR